MTSFRIFKGEGTIGEYPKIQLLALWKLNLSANVFHVRSLKVSAPRSH
jgi:hypothetical protein